MEFDNTCVVCRGRGVRGNGQRCGVCDGHGHIRPVSTFTFFKMLYYLAGVIAICGLCGYFAFGRGDRWWGPQQSAEPTPAVTAAAPGDNDDSPPEQVTATDLSGDVWAFGTQVDSVRRTVTFDKIDWFEGSAATKACKENNEPITDGALCHDYYYRNRNTLLRTATLANSATITLVDDTATGDYAQQKPVSLPELASAISAPRRTILILTIRNGVIARIREQFTP